MKNKNLLIFIFALLISILMPGCSLQEISNPATLAITDARIATMNQEAPFAEALAVSGDRIIAVGSNEEIEAYITAETQVLSPKEGLIIPGFIDGHAHLTGIGESLRRLDLAGASSWEEIVGIVEKAARNSSPGEWILGRGWHQEKWNQPPDPSVEGLPVHYSLSEVTPDNPVLLVHASGHSCLANAKAMETAGITRSTSDPEGGEILRDSSGSPTGAFRETAQGLIRSALAGSREARAPRQVESELRETVQLAAEECLRKGITTLHDAGSSSDLVDLLKTMVDEKSLPIRLNVMLSEPNGWLREHLPEYRLEGYGGNMLTVRSIKRLMDGALGSHGAWLLEPYSDLPSSLGLQTCADEKLEETARIALANDFQVCVHAIGDRANREVLNIYEKVLNGKTDARWRIEHAQHLSAQDIPRFAELGILAAMQSIHCTSDGPWVVEKIGRNRASEGAYVWRKLLDSGALIGNGTDAPVEDVDPIPCYYAAVSRKTAAGERFFPEQAMTRMEALRSYTINNAYMSFEEKEKGSLESGKLADITILSQDILSVPEDQILNTEVLYTIVGGKIQYRKE